MSDLPDDIDKLDEAVADLKAALWDGLLVPQLERIASTLNRHLIYIGTLIKGTK